MDRLYIPLGAALAAGAEKTGAEAAPDGAAEAGADAAPDGAAEAGAEAAPGKMGRIISQVLKLVISLMGCDVPLGAALDPPPVEPDPALPPTVTEALPDPEKASTARTWKLKSLPKPWAAHASKWFAMVTVPEVR